MSNQINDTGKEHRQFGTGATRDNCENKGMPSLLSPIALMECAVHLQHGAEKYDIRNWEAGMPLCTILDSLYRHIWAELMGDNSENHCGAIMCNAMFFVHTKRMIEAGLLPEGLDDLPKYKQQIEAKQYNDAIDEQFPTPKKPTTATEVIALQNGKDLAYYHRVLAKSLCKSAEPDKTRAYMCHSIRGRKGVDATEAEMNANNNKAIEAGERLRWEHPELDVYVPGDHDEFIMIGYKNGVLTETEILDIDCGIVEQRDVIIMYTEDGYLSRGMVTEVRYARGRGKQVWWYDGCDLYKDTNIFIFTYPEEWSKVC